MKKNEMPGILIGYLPFFASREHSKIFPILPTQTELLRS